MPSTAQAARTAELQATLERAITDLCESQEWTQFLRYHARFHRYSVNNIMLIAAQYPSATYLRGLKGWTELGRMVRKGSESIWILAPRTARPKDDDDEETQRRTYFSAIGVFDIAQTDPRPGAKYVFEPPILPDAKGDEDVALQLWDALETYVIDDGWKVTQTNDHVKRLITQTRGYCAYATKTIWVNPDLPVVDALATLVHEVCHKETLELRDEAKEVREVIVESATYMALDRFGIDSLDRAAMYDASWMGDAESFRTVSATTFKVAHLLLDVMERAVGVAMPEHATTEA
jgi:antirestriction protein ArdC